ncbi:hypothetical protein MH928_06725 [Flavobacterium sp. WW92]|uniref:hypothetical protein n=1 Tax=unclassified Flavobacterium TaxID=196869 RepID=UPI002224BCE5|nr:MULTISPECIES: hypothetical protein [unclassified Flavobacterium]WDO14383.1 hypothetical protein MH928_06725 [Flavobacterium sp. WW92]
MRHSFKYIFILLFTLKIAAQADKETYLFSKDIEAKIQKDTLPWRYQMGATDYSISEYYTKALETWDRNGGTIKKISKEDSLYFNSFQKKNAKEYIINRSKDEKIIIINEAHHNNRHRVFTASLLQGLYDNGYRFFGLEALADSLINERKFPVLESGFYVKEPQMANLLKEALKIGFVLFEYEAVSGKNGKEREIEEAENIAQLIRKNPNSKFLIHCGWDHVIEGTPNNKNWEKAMAGRLKEKANIDPFTIDQVTYTEKGNPKFTNPYVLMANPKESVVLVNGNGKLFNGGETNDQTDCRIIHPITEYINGRPDWLTIDGQRKIHTIPKSKITQYPILALAYRKNEVEQNGVPADIIEITNKETKADFILEKGMYKIILKDKNYKIIQEFDANVK